MLLTKEILFYNWNLAVAVEHEYPYCIKLKTVRRHYMINPNYNDLGLSSPMSSEVRQLVEQQLLEDLKHYGVEKDNLKFDWSVSCIEGHDTKYLGSWVENYSGIGVYDESDNLVAEGWMDFVHEGDVFIVYWDYITAWNINEKLAEKEKPGIPNHIWAKVPDDIKWNYEAERKRYTDA